MSAVRNFLFLHLFTALLPPKNGNSNNDNDNDNDNGDNNNDTTTNNDTNDTRNYYEILGIKARNNKAASHQDIRKAYKLKSLQLHPDKIAQRRRGRSSGTNDQDLSEEQLKIEYEKVQEAYACLIDPRNRQQYHQLGCSNARYQFVVVQNGLYHPSLVYHNLQHSSCWNKTRLLILMAVILCTFLVQPVLIAAKINQQSAEESGGILADTPWTLVLIPLWVFQGFIVVCVTALLCLVGCCQNNKDDNSSNSWLWIPLLLLLFEHCCWFVGNFLLALRWDGNETIVQWSWHYLSIPYYVALLFRMMGNIATAKQTRYTQAMMVSSDKMVSLIHEKEQKQEAEQQQQAQTNTNEGDNSNASAADTDTGGDATTEDDQREKIIAELERQYRVVTVDDDAVASALHFMRMDHNNEGGGEVDNNNNEPPLLDEDEMEYLKISTSPEYTASEHIINQQIKALMNVLVFGITFVALTACKLEGQISDNVSWWVVFVPVWVYFGYQIFKSYCTCCCVSMSGDPVVILPSTTATTTTTGVGGDGTGGGENNQEEDVGNDGDPAVVGESLKSSVNFASAEGVMNEFNNKQDDEEKQRKVSAATAADGAGSKESGSGNAATAAADTAGDEAAPAAASASENDKEQEGNSSANNNQDVIELYKEEDESKNKGHDDGDGGDGAADNNVDDDNPHIRIDEETFHAWQHAQEKAESSAMEKQAKAQSTCCWASFQLIIVCLIVGKLEHYYDDNPNDTGYNAFWILFPIFVVMGILLCCCCCLVYGAGASAGLDDLVERAEHMNDHDEEDNNNNNDDEEQQNDNVGGSGSGGNAPTTTEGDRPDEPAVVKSEKKDDEPAELDKTEAVSTTQDDNEGQKKVAGDIENGAAGADGGGGGEDINDLD